MNIEKEVRKLTREGYTPTQIVDKLKIDLKDFPVDVYREELRKIKGIKDDENEIFEEDEGDEENMKKKRSKKKDEDIEEEENKEEKDEENEEDEEDKENEEQEGILPYPKTIKPPEEWFEEFIKPFGVSKEFLRIYKQRIKRRKELPHPNELAADLADMKSGITNARAINYICEEYAYALEDYLREVGENERLLRRSFGIKVSTPRPSPPSYYGYSAYPQYGYNSPDNPFYPPYPYPQPYQYNPQPPYSQPPHSPPPGDGGFLKELKELREEVKNLKLSSSRNDGTRAYIDQLLKKIEKLEDELKERDRERIERLERELERARMSGISRDEIEDMVRRTIEEYKGRLTPEDVKKIIEDEIKKLDLKLSKEDREYLIAKERLELEREKLRNEGKTKEMVANAIRTGLASVGEAIARTLTEAGTEKTFEVTGRQQGEIWNFQCPNCGSPITAPMGNKIVTCPRCGVSYTVELPQSNLPVPSPATNIPSQPIEQPKQEQEEPQEKIEEKPQQEKTEEPKQEIEEKFVCPVCGKEFPTERKLRGHMIHHKMKGGE